LQHPVLFRSIKCRVEVFSMNTHRQFGRQEGKLATGLSVFKMILTEEQLVQACIRKERKAQKALVERYGRTLMLVCKRYAPRKYAPEDILQDAFMKIFRNLEKFDSSKGNLEVWMRRVTINVALSRIRSYAKNVSLESNPERLPEIPADPAIYQAMDTEELLKAIDQIPDGYREVFNLCVIEGYSHAEAAEILNIAPGTSRSYLTRARKMIIDQLKKLEYKNYERRAV